MRVAFGNEGAPQVVEAFAQRFGVHVIDGFGATEGGLAVNRDDESPPGAVGRAGPEVKIFGDDDRELPRATFDATGALVDPTACVGEIVNTAGVGVFEGYYNNPEANARATRNGWYWSGDLGYIDEAGFLYFAGRTADWIRVDGENFPAGPIEVIVARHPSVMLCAVYGVPDIEAGDRVMATLVLRDGRDVRSGRVRHAGSTPRPTSARRVVPPTSGSPPRSRRRPPTRCSPAPSPTRSTGPISSTATRCGSDVRGDEHYRPFGAAEADAMRAAMKEAGRERFWDL